MMGKKVCGNVCILMSKKERKKSKNVGSVVGPTRMMLCILVKRKINCITQTCLWVIDIPIDSRMIKVVRIPIMGRM